MKSTSPFLGRFVAVATAVVTLALALLPVIANLDWASSAGVFAAIAAILTVFLKWLGGLQAHEARVADQLGVQAAPLIYTSSGTTNITAKPGAVTHVPDMTADRDPEPPTASPDAARDDLDDPDYEEPSS